jgi:type I restriction enzyme, S subunit
MQAVDNTYLKFIDFTKLINWSSYALLGKNLIYNQKYPFVRIGDFLKRNKEQVTIEDGVLYKRPKIKTNVNGISLRGGKLVDGTKIGTKNQFRTYKGQFLLSKIDARNGAFGVVPIELDNAIITGNFWTFDVDSNLINPHYLTLLAGTKEFQKLCQTASVGTTNRNYLQENSFLNFEIPLPTLVEQEILLDNYNNKINEAERLQKQAEEIEKNIEEYLFQQLGLEKVQHNNPIQKGLQIVFFEIISEWGLDKILAKSNTKSTNCPITSIERTPQLVKELFRGKSPKYKVGSNVFILNQKCNRWNEIDLNFVKSVDVTWLNSIESNFLTKEGDVLINSTGEGTIGRASYIKKEHEGFLYDSHLLLLRLNNTIINSELFVEIFNSKYGQKQVNQLKSAQATKQTELGISNLAKVCFPLPESLEMQNKIIETIKKIRRRKIAIIRDSSNLKIEAEQEFEKAIFK